MANKKRIKQWNQDHADRILEYRKKQASQPNYFRKAALRRRMKVLSVLGGKCVVCGIDDLLFLQCHYIPTIKGMGWRHPKHDRWIIDHKEDFMLLCANHHQELSITNQIRGFNVEDQTNKVKHVKTLEEFLQI